MKKTDILILILMLFVIDAFVLGAYHAYHTRHMLKHTHIEGKITPHKDHTSQEILGNTVVQPWGAKEFCIKNPETCGE